VRVTASVDTFKSYLNMVLGNWL